MNKSLIKVGCMVAFAMGTIAVGAVKSNLTEYGLRQVPNFELAKSQNASFSEGLYWRKIRVQRQIYWQDLKEEFQLSQSMVEWSYACTRGWQVDFGKLKQERIYRNDEITIVLRKDACPRKQAEEDSS
ncbi:hypothetical protein [Pseudoduganella umbonata]|uniref:Uncharacterized protein n=1 Tax=Pseudoduganella umbonata TaxID=864828 RepID=A0A4P8HPS2_9BURK|nr:hypothetical protein [Pseudoduganella umbonata]MBB3221280.1 hypothetical protein [Pseudoduganella umbonata]QCP10454.1 hypothetical protein FCL38_08450 [Pseudoduganella umbonata]